MTRPTAPEVDAPRRRPRAPRPARRARAPTRQERREGHPRLPSRGREPSRVIVDGERAGQAQALPSRPASSRAPSRAPSCRCATSSRSTTPDGHAFTHPRPLLASPPTLGELDLHLIGEGRHEELYEHARRPRARDRRRRRARRSRCGRRPRASVSVVGDFNSWDGRLHPMRSLGSSGHLGGVPPRRRRGRPLQVRDPHRRRRAAAEGRPGRASPPRCRRRPASVVHRPTHEWSDDDVDGAPPRARAAARADVDLRGPPRLLAAEPAGGQPLAHLPRARRRAGRLRHRPGLHARRAAAGDGAPVQRLLGLPGDRPTSRPRRASARPTTSARSSTACTPAGLGVILDWVPGALPPRRLGAGPLRRHRAVRARRPAPRRPPRLGHAGVQLRPPRGAQLPARQRPVLAARVPRRRDPRRRRRLDALPRLLAQRGRVDPEPVRRPRGPRGGRVPQGA